jgi:hypothetical protein
MSTILPRPPAQKTAVLRDRKYLDWLRTQPCIITGARKSSAWPLVSQSVDPLHVGTAGKGLKSPDDETLPVSHSLHMEGHQSGEMTMFRKHMSDSLLRECLRAYAREMYQEYLADLDKLD